MKAAIRDPDPVVFLENELLYVRPLAATHVVEGGRGGLGVLGSVVGGMKGTERGVCVRNAVLPPGFSIHLGFRV